MLRPEIIRDLDLPRMVFGDFALDGTFTPCQAVTISGESTIMARLIERSHRHSKVRREAYDEFAGDAGHVPIVKPDPEYGFRPIPATLNRKN